MGGYVVDHANVVLSSGTMDETHNGKYGTVDSPALVYVALDAGETLVLKGNFAGHGVLLIDVPANTTNTVLSMEGAVDWVGLVVVRVESGLGDMGSEFLVHLQTESSILGGLAYVVDPESFAGGAEVPSGKGKGKAVAAGKGKKG